MSDVAALVAPSVRWHEEYGYALAEQELEAARALGCRAMLLQGGPLLKTTRMLARLRGGSEHAWIVAAELNGGAGERFAGATALPPLAALDAADGEAIRRAARLTAREARSAGINCIVAPSCIIPDHATPLERARTFAGEDAIAAAACSEWIDACQAEGVIAMPGPYPLMRPSAAVAALDAGVAAILLATSHATDADVIKYLRENAGFDGIIAAPLGALANAQGADEADLAVTCVAAGADVLLGCDDTADVVRVLRAAVTRGTLDGDVVRVACARLDSRAAWADVTAPGREPTLDDVLWARRAADAVVHAQRGNVPALCGPLDLIVVDDDPVRMEPAGTAFRLTLAKLGYELCVAGEGRTSIIAVFGDRRIELGFDTFSEGARVQVQDACARAQRTGCDAMVVHFTPPDFASAFEGTAPIVCAWSGTRAMEEASARWLHGRSRGMGDGESGIGVT